MDKEVLLNNFAIRSFRDVADNDYICARMAARARLVSQFLWLALQCIEKYLKCILLLNRISSKGLGHDIQKALSLVREHIPFEIRLSEGSIELIMHLNIYGRFRYFEIPYHVEGLELLQLDRTVWEIRRYCTVLDYTLKLEDGSVIEMLPHKIEQIKRSEDHPGQKFYLTGGVIESIIADKKHPAREPLIWKNLYYGRRVKLSIQFVKFCYIANSPLSLHDEMLDELLKYVYLPKDVISAYREKEG